MSPLNVVISMYIFISFSVAFCERVQQADAQCGNSRFFFQPKQRLSVIHGNTVGGKSQQRSDGER